MALTTMPTVVLPGDRFSLPSSSSVKLGPGLALPSTQSRSDGDDGEGGQQVVVTLPGFLGQVKSDKGKGKAISSAEERDRASQSQQSQVAYWVESNSKRYLPALHDRVICQITNRGTESYQVTLFNSYTPATLSAFAFEGATKRNKPNLKVGSLLYAQVISANRHLEVELSCVDQTTGKSNGYGELKTEGGNSGEEQGAKGGEEMTAMVWNISCGLSRSLLKPSHPLLARLAPHFPFEVAVGVNGFVWARASQPRHVIAVGKVLQRADQISGGDSGIGKEGRDALQVTKNRGVLSADEIASIVGPYK